MLFLGFVNWRVRLLIVSLVLLVTGAWMFAPTWNARELAEWNLTDLCTGKLPDSNWVRVRGRLVWEEAATEEGRGGRIQAYFVPFVPGGWNHSQPVHVIVRINKYDAEEMQNSATVEGLIQPLGLPFDLRIAFSGDDGAKAADNVVYIHHGTDPRRQRQFATVVLAIGFAGVIGFVVMWRIGAGEIEPPYHSMAKARDLNEAVQRTAVEEEKHLQREAERESEVDRWMRERGINTRSADEVVAAEARESAATH